MRARITIGRFTRLTGLTGRGLLPMLFAIIVILNAMAIVDPNGVWAEDTVSGTVIENLMEQPALYVAGDEIVCLQMAHCSVALIQPARFEAPFSLLNSEAGVIAVPVRDQVVAPPFHPPIV